MTASLCRYLTRSADGRTCQTCGRAVTFTPSRRPGAYPGDGFTVHTADAGALQRLEQRRRREVPTDPAD